MSAAPLTSSASTSLLSPASRSVVQATAAVVAEHAEQITARFYPRMFEEHPELLRVFNQGNQATGEQSRALAASVVAYAVQLIDPDAPSFDRVMQRIAYKHISLGHPAGAVHDRRPPPAGRGRRGARRGRHAGDRRGLGRGLLAVRDPAHRGGGPALPAGGRRPGPAAAAVPGGPADRGDRRRRVPGARAHRRRPAAADRPGAVRLGVRGPARRPAPAPAVHRLLHGAWRPGCRSRCARSTAWAAPRTAWSRRTCTTGPAVGDVVDVSAPAGDFVVQPSDGPLLLASAGAGITTVLPIVEHIARTQPQRKVIVAHADRTAQDHALRDTVLHVGRQIDDFTAYTWYERVDPDRPPLRGGLHGPRGHPAAGRTCRSSPADRCRSCGTCGPACWRAACRRPTSVTRCSGPTCGRRRTDPQPYDGTAGARRPSRRGLRRWAPRPGHGRSCGPVVARAGGGVEQHRPHHRAAILRRQDTPGLADALHQHHRRAGDVQGLGVRGPPATGAGTPYGDAQTRSAARDGHLDVRPVVGHGVWSPAR